VIIALYKSTLYLTLPYLRVKSVGAFDTAFEKLLCPLVSILANYDGKLVIIERNLVWLIVEAKDLQPPTGMA